MGNKRLDALADKIEKIVEREIKKAGIDADYFVILVAADDANDSAYAVEKIASRYPPAMMYNYLLQFHKDKPEAFEAALARATGKLQ